MKLFPVTVTCVPIGPDAGVNEVTTGAGAFATVTLSLADAVLPATSVACALIVLGPETRFTEQLKEPLCTVAGTPLHVTAATPDRLSDTEPVTETEVEETVAPFAGEVMLMLGGVLSRLMVTDVEAVFPAASVAVPEIT